jgi:hypothetical protein
MVGVNAQTWDVCVICCHLIDLVKTDSKNPFWLSGNERQPSAQPSPILFPQSTNTHWAPTMSQVLFLRNKHHPSLCREGGCSERISNLCQATRGATGLGLTHDSLALFFSLGWELSFLWTSVFSTSNGIWIVLGVSGSSLPRLVAELTRTQHLSSYPLDVCVGSDRYLGRGTCRGKQVYEHRVHV